MSRQTAFFFIDEIFTEFAFFGDSKYMKSYRERGKYFQFELVNLPAIIQIILGFA